MVTEDDERPAAPPFEQDPPTAHIIAQQYRDRRRGWLRQFWQAQLHLRNWIFVREIASWRARTDGSVSEARREDVYRLFKVALLRGVFQRDGRTTVHWVNPEYPFRRLTLDYAERFVSWHPGDLAGLISQCFQWCVLSHQVA